MSDEHVLPGFSRERLEEIWSRVMPSDPPPSEVFDSLLQPFDPSPEFAADYLPTSQPATSTERAAHISTTTIDRELTLVRTYCELARIAPSKPASRTLFELSNDQFSNAKSAAGIYFFDTGKYHFPAIHSRSCARPPEGASGYRPRLRDAWKEERSLAALYISLADASPSDSEPGYLTLAHSHSQHAMMLRSLLEDSLG